MGLTEFYEATPFEVGVYASAYYKRKGDEQEARISLAYNHAYWVALWNNGKKPESLEKILNKTPEEMGDEDMFKQIKVLNAAMGGEVI